jgi:hypothetical protein
MFLVSKERPVRRADNLTRSVSRLPRQCGILNISQPYRPPLPAAGDRFYWIEMGRQLQAPAALPARREPLAQI